jgi:hypothetical protein
MPSAMLSRTVRPASTGPENDAHLARTDSERPGANVVAVENDLTRSGSTTEHEPQQCRSCPRCFSDHAVRMPAGISHEKRSSVSFRPAPGVAS